MGVYCWPRTVVSVPEIFFNSHNFMRERFPPFTADSQSPEILAQLTCLEEAVCGLFSTPASCLEGGSV